MTLSIRLAKPQDAPHLLAIYRPYVQKTAITFETEVPSLQEFEQRILTTLQTHPYLVAEQEGKVLGYAYAHPYYGRAAYQWTAEVSIYVAENARTKGIGTILYDKLEALLAKQGMVNLLACLAYPNPAPLSLIHI